MPKNLTEFPLPIVIAGGVSSLKDVKSYIKIGADAVGAEAFFVFKGPQDAVLISYPQGGYNKNYTGLKWVIKYVQDVLDTTTDDIKFDEIIIAITVQIS